MARIVVTGAAGFIGSRLAEQLLAEGESVLGIDSFSDYYEPSVKRARIASLEHHPGFSFEHLDLAELTGSELFRGAEEVYHLAGRPGARANWGATYSNYVSDNILATARLLECLANSNARVVIASSSSVYGEMPGAVTEEHPLRPLSPYGITKAAVEKIAAAHARTSSLAVMVVRPFSVYGPGQRPDMAFSRFIQSLLREEPVTVVGDGRQERDFTYVDDVVKGLVQCARRGRSGAVYNLASGRPVGLLEVIEMLGEIASVRPRVEFTPLDCVEPRSTHGDFSRACAELGYSPSTHLADGLRAQFTHACEKRALPASSRTCPPGRRAGAVGQMRP